MDHLCLTLSQQHKALDAELQMFDQTNQNVRQELERGQNVNRMRSRMNQDLCESHRFLETMSPDKYPARQQPSYYWYLLISYSIYSYSTDA